MRTFTRAQLIDEIRKAALHLVDEDNSFCKVLGELGLGCHGFRRLDDAALRERYAWLGKDAVDRKRLESLANRWQLARQLVLDSPIACDVQAREHDGCNGWKEYDDAALLELYHSICSREEVQVV